MLHILAISGMNVGLLWTWLWCLCRWSGCSAYKSTWVILVALPVYAIVTDANPPIVRATVVAVIVAFGQLIGRTGSVSNALALAALAILVWNPTDLFNTGAQLSFLAVLAIIHATNWMKMFYEQTSQKTDDAPLDDPFWRRMATRTFWAVIEANVVGAAVWLITSPLIASEFHLVSPIGSVLTVLLAIPVTIMFWIGYSFLLLGMVSSTLFGWLGSIFDVWLRAFLWTVKAGAGLELGHVYVPAPPSWWTIGFYLFTLLPLALFTRRGWGSAISVRFGLAWMALGLLWGLSRPPHPGVTCTFISVGHGLSVLVECPNGRTLLYDAGGMVGGNSIARTISQAVWTTGRTKLDAVVISHADGDHCNALPELSRVVSPGGLFVHHSFLDWQQPVVASAIERTAGIGAKVRLISEGQSLVVDPTVSMRVLHPPPDFRSPRDNPNSIVLCIEYAGRRIVLTGDLELEGLERLLKTPPTDTDVLLSPHHGSLKANPPDLARWATPEYVVVSTPEPIVAERLATRFGPETQILTTATYGAVICQINPDGDLHVEPFRKNPYRKLKESRSKLNQQRSAIQANRPISNER
jgi:competence protein ComEC